MISNCWSMVFTFGGFLGLPLNFEIRRSALSCIPGMWMGSGSVWCNGFNSCQGSSDEMLLVTLLLVVNLWWIFKHNVMQKTHSKQKQKWHAFTPVLYPMYQRPFIIFKFLFFRTDILKGRNKQRGILCEYIKSLQNIFLLSITEKTACYAEPQIRIS